MWLYIPPLPGAPRSTPSPSAQVAEGSISASSWQFQAIARSLTWRGKPSHVLIWSQRWNKVFWLKRLCGVMPEPSLADSFAAAWIASLAVSHASPIQSRESARAKKTSATSGSPSVASSSRRARGARSSKTCPAWSHPAGLSGSGETFTGWVLRLKQDSSARKRLVRAMAARGSSCSPSINPPSQGGGWPTATANDFKGSGPTLMRKDGKMRGYRLDCAAEQIWSSPRASDGEKGGPNQSFTAGGVPLPAMASQWPTPGATTANNDTGLMKSGDGRSTPNKLGWAAGSWPTIRAAEAGGCQYSRGDRNKLVPTLTGAGTAWSAPNTVDAKGGNRRSPGQRQLAHQVQDSGHSSRPARATSYGTPSRRSILSAFQRYRSMTCSSMRAEMRALIRMAIRAERAGQRRGFTRPSYRKSLNARFVAWLMGWPDHWTSICLAHPASMPSACSAMALSRWRARMRSELSALPLPGDMAPIQPDLFGKRHDG